MADHQQQRGQSWPPIRCHLFVSRLQGFFFIWIWWRDNCDVALLDLQGMPLGQILQVSSDARASTINHIVQMLGRKKTDSRSGGRNLQIAGCWLEGRDLVFCFYPPVYSNMGFNNGNGQETFTITVFFWQRLPFKHVRCFFNLHAGLLGCPRKLGSKVRISGLYP